MASKVQCVIKAMEPRSLRSILVHCPRTDSGQGLDESSSMGRKEGGC